MESLQASLESEKCAEDEGLRIKKKLEPDINEFEIALDHANKALKNYQGHFRESECTYEEASHVRQEMV